jgi:undecaprenyl diphosphate synthase
LLSDAFQINHVGIIMDGNGRWANDQGLPRAQGHFKGAKVVKDIIKAAPSLGIKVLTIYAFSTENWNRPKYEIKILMGLFQSEITKQFEELLENNVRIRFIGSKVNLPKSLIQATEKLEATTEHNTGLIVQVALNYGGRRDIVDAVKKIGHNIKSGLLDPEEIGENHISEAISTAGIIDPELIIRTSGELRISNFLLWQSAYSEFAFIEKHWPDFTPEDLGEIIKEVGTRKRRFGGIKPV